MNASRFQRQQCYLCDCPRAPWAILNDFTEPVCRGCCNYEGPDRIEAVIDYVRSLRKGWEHQVRNSKSLNSTGTSIGSSPSPGGHSNGSIDANGNPTQYPFSGQYHSLIPHHSAEHMRFLHSVKSEQAQQQQHAPGEGENFPPKTPYGPNEPGGPPSSGNPRSAEEINHDERRFMPHPKDLPPSSRMPIIRRPPEYSEYPEVVRETLEILNTCVPFDIRFKKDHNHVGRVFLFEAAPRTGATSSNEYELKLHLEYPRGSESFTQSVSAVAKQMYQDSTKELGRGISSGFKYLEYEVQGSPSEWRLLADLIPEAVRFFKDPISRNFLPIRVTDHPTYHPMLGPPPFNQAKYRHKRKAEDLEPHVAPSRAPRRTYKEREDEQIQRHLWMQSQVDALRLSMAHLTAPPETMHMNTIRSSAMMDHPRHPAPLPHAPITPGSAPPTTPHQPSPKGPWGVPTSMAALISAAGADTNHGGTLREGRKASSEHIKSKSPNNDKEPTEKEKDESHKLEENVDRKELGPVPEGHTKKSGGKGVSQLKCSICEDWLEDTHFVQCPSVTTHKFCFPCSKDSIKKQGLGNDVFCPSGKRCPLIGSNLPWAFMQSEIQTILATKGRPQKMKEEPSAPVKEEEKP